MSENGNGLAAALLAFQAEAPSIQKDGINPHFRSKYVSLEKLMETVLPLLNSHGLVLTQHPTIVDGQPALRTKVLHAGSGESEEDTMLLLSDKPGSQALGAAITYARRYALMAVLGLVADEDDDGNASSPRPRKDSARGGAAAPARAEQPGGELGGASPGSQFAYEPKATPKAKRALEKLYQDLRQRHNVDEDKVVASLGFALGFGFEAALDHASQLAVVETTESLRLWGERADKNAAAQVLADEQGMP